MRLVEEIALFSYCEIVLSLFFNIVETVDCGRLNSLTKSVYRESTVVMCSPSLAMMAHHSVNNIANYLCFLDL